MESALGSPGLDSTWFPHRQGPARTVVTAEAAEASASWSDEDLVRKVQKGDADAFELIYQKHVPRVYALCLRMLSDPRHAEEATQDVFVRLWENLDSFEFRSAFRTWLHRLGVNVVLGRIRSETRRADKTLSVADVELFEREVKEAMPETKLDLEKAIATLPAGAKEVLILHDIQGFRYREIAELVGIAEGTVKSQLSRARRLVREALGR